MATVNLDYAILHLDGNGAKLGEVIAKYGDEVTVSVGVGLGLGDGDGLADGEGSGLEVSVGPEVTVGALVQPASSPRASAPTPTPITNQRRHRLHRPFAAIAPPKPWTHNGRVLFPAAVRNPPSG